MVWFGLTQYQSMVALSLDETEKIRDRPDAMENAPNESPLRHQTQSGICREADTAAPELCSGLCATAHLLLTTRPLDDETAGWGGALRKGAAAQDRITAFTAGKRPGPR